MEQGEKFDSWGVIEVMGHKKFAGRITEQTIAGAALIRVDVPELSMPDGSTRNAFSKLIGVGSIYCITPTTEEVARKAAVVCAQYETNPLPVYIPETRQLATASVVDDDDDDQPY